MKTKPKRNVPADRGKRNRKLQFPTGERFGRLTARHEGERRGLGTKNPHRTAVCECDCGNIVVKDLANLMAGDYQRCGWKCGLEEWNINPKQPNPLGRYWIRKRKVECPPAGTEFGDLKVLREGEDENGHRTVVCKCKCGEVVTKLLSNLLKGANKRCGLKCKARKRKPKPKKHPLGTRAPRKRTLECPIAQEFGELTAICEGESKERPTQNGRRRTHRVVVCRCNCGEFVVVDLYNLLSGKHNCCGRDCTAKPPRVALTPEQKRRISEGHKEAFRIGTNGHTDIYSIRLDFPTGETVYKIGISRKTSSRIICLTREAGAQVEVIKVVSGPTRDIKRRESELKAANAAFRAVPPTRFGGYTECFSRPIDIG